MRRTGYRYFLWYYCTVLSGKMWQEIWTKVEPEINNCSSATLVRTPDPKGCIFTFESGLPEPPGAEVLGGAGAVFIPAPAPSLL